GGHGARRRRHCLAELLGEIEARVQGEEEARLLELLPERGRRGEQRFGLARHGRNEHDAQAGGQREQRDYDGGYGDLARQATPGQRFDRVVHGHGQHARSQREGDRELRSQEEEDEGRDGQHAEADGEDGLESDLPGGPSRSGGDHSAVLPEFAGADLLARLCSSPRTQIEIPVTVARWLVRFKSVAFFAPSLSARWRTGTTEGLSPRPVSSSTGVATSLTGAWKSCPASPACASANHAAASAASAAMQW